MPLPLPDALTESLSPHLDLSKSRLETLSGLIVGIVNARTVNLSHVAAQFSDTAKTGSSYRRLQRFFQYVELDGDWTAQSVISILGIKPPWLVCIDRTQWKVGRSDINILMLAVVKGRRRIPLMWTLLNDAGTFHSDQRIALMQRYLDLFGAASIRYLLADREFIGPRWIDFLLRKNVLFSIRVKDNLNVVLDDDRTHRFKTLLQKPAFRKALTTRKGRLATMSSDSGLPLRFAARRLRSAELLVIITNGDPHEAMRLYKRRWFIECLFGDSKRRGLNIEDTRLTDQTKLSTLLAVVTFAIVWAYACAKAIKSSGPIAKTNQGYLRKSVFRHGFDQLRKWIAKAPRKAIDVWISIWPKNSQTIKFKRVV